SLWFLFRVFKSPKPPHPWVTAESFAESLPVADEPAPARTASVPAGSHGHAHEGAPHLGPLAADRETLLLLSLAALLGAGMWTRLRDGYDRWRIRNRTRSD